MTRDRKPKPGEPYKQVYVKDINGQRYYTTGNLNEDDYMNLSAIWLKLKKKKLRQDPQCELCKTAKNLRIHHIRYPEVWGEEKIEDLMTLCDACHEKVHQFDNERRQ